MGKYPPPILDLPPEHDTPFQAWMNSAVKEMEIALDLSRIGTPVDPVRRVHLFKAFDALMWAMKEVIEAEKK